MIKIIVGNRNAGKTTELLNIHGANNGILMKKLYNEQGHYGYDAILMKDGMKRTLSYLRRGHKESPPSQWEKRTDRLFFNPNVHRMLEIIAFNFIEGLALENEGEILPAFVVDEVGPYELKNKTGTYEALKALIRAQASLRLSITTTKNNLNDLMHLIKSTLEEGGATKKEEISIDYLHDLSCVVIDQIKDRGDNEKKAHLLKFIKEVSKAKSFSKIVFVSEDSTVKACFDDMPEVKLILLNETSMTSKLYKKGLLEAMSIRPSGCMLVSLYEESFTKPLVTREQWNKVTRQFKTINQKKLPCDLKAIGVYKTESMGIGLKVFSNYYFRSLLKLKLDETGEKIIADNQEDVYEGRL